MGPQVDYEAYLPLAEGHHLSVRQGVKAIEKQRKCTMKSHEAEAQQPKTCDHILFLFFIYFQIELD